MAESIFGTEITDLTDKPDVEQSDLGNLAGKRSLINEFFTETQIKALFYLACRVDIADNNDKAAVVSAILPPDEFDEVGTGTNRIALLHNGFICKIALDRRGLVDNWAEFKRSIELPEYLAKTYESNILINIAEYVNVINRAQFLTNEPFIKATLADISKAYLFDDIGFTTKNLMNWGYRENVMKDEASLCILDYGYFYPLKGQDKERLFRCPRCGGRLQWNNNYVKFECRASGCRVSQTPQEIRNRMQLDFEEFENQFLTSINSVDTPDFTNIEAAISLIR